MMVGLVLLKIVSFFAIEAAEIDHLQRIPILLSMASKTISLAQDAYEKLKTAKRKNESFSQVVRRLKFDDEVTTGAGVLHYLADLKPFHSGFNEGASTYLEKSVLQKRKFPTASPSPWSE